MADPIAITGVGVVSPLGDSADRFRDALVRGDAGIAVDPAFASQGCRSVLSARVAGFEPAKWIPPMKLRRMDTTGPLALVAIRQAMDAAGYAVGAGDARAGVVLGTYSAGGQATREYLEGLFKGGPSGAPALLFNSTVGNAAAGLAGLEYKLCGPNATISQKESSGLAAIAAAVDLLRLERADRVAAGGMDAIFDLFYRGHDRFNVMSAAREPGESLAPFARSRAGFVLGEGAYVMWLERGPSSGGGPEILGTGAASETCGINMWPDDPDTIVRSMALALEDAGLTTSDVDVIYASANATRKLDDVEARALAALFGSRPIVTSIKGAIGECSATGAAACVAAVLCGALGNVPPIVGLRDPDPVAATLNLARTATAAPGSVALVNSIASGGAVYSAVLRTPITESA